MMRPKAIVLRDILSFLSQFCPLPAAHVCTLGGEGLEAGIWKDLGIPGGHGWLVERSPRQMRTLIREYPEYTLLHGQLRRLPEFLRDQYGDRANLDCFHWDLCGTVEPAIRELTVMLPFLAQSRGRTLGVTVADERRNLSLEAPKKIHDLAELTFGSEWPNLWKHLVAVHTETCVQRDSDANPEYIALREAATMIHLFYGWTALDRRAGKFVTRERNFPLNHFLAFRRGSVQSFQKPFKAGKMILVPAAIQRYVYWSGPNGFRMRSYAFRMKVLKDPIPLALAGKRFAKLIRMATYGMVEDETVRQVMVTTSARKQIHKTNVVEKQREQPVAETKSNSVDDLRKKFEPVIAVMGEEHRQDFERLIELAKAGDRAAAVLNIFETGVASARKLVNGAGGNHAPAKAAQAKAPAAATAAPPQPTKAGRGISKNGTLPIAAVDDIVLELLEAEAKSPESLQTMYDEVAKRLGIGRKKNRYRRIGGILARGQGKFRHQFLARMLQRDLPPGGVTALIRRLAKAYGEPVDTLRKEAETSPYWKATP